MRQPLYIISACSISAQHTYDEDNFLSPATSSDNGRLLVIDPDYSKFINPVAIRRMSRALKRGITAGMRALADAGVKTPDAIIVGTSRGSVTDMEVFLHELIELKEQALNPSGFIQSTYNSVNGWLAMLSKCTAYNQTYVHRGFSLELSLFDAMLTFAETTEKKHLLVGGFDELTYEYYIIRDKISYYKKDVPNSLDLLAHNDTPGSVGGEGAQFFTLSNDPANAACAIHSLEMLHTPTAAEVSAAIADMLAQNGLANSDIDVLVCGMNGDSRSNFLTEPVIANCAPHTTIAAFKHLCGEYDTASGFGLWLADFLFRKQQIPEGVIYKQGSAAAIKNILFYNVTITGNVSLMLLKSIG
jgi:3-oxoacyl-[acyl-carrier-protein] synthase II